MEAQKRRLGSTHTLHSIDSWGLSHAFDDRHHTGDAGIEARAARSLTRRRSRPLPFVAAAEVATRARGQGRAAAAFGTNSAMALLSRTHGSPQRVRGGIGHAGSGGGSCRHGGGGGSAGGLCTLASVAQWGWKAGCLGLLGLTLCLWAEVATGPDGALFVGCRQC